MRRFPPKEKTKSPSPFKSGKSFPIPRSTSFRISAPKRFDKLCFESVTVTSCSAPPRLIVSRAVFKDLGHADPAHFSHTITAHVFPGDVFRTNAQIGPIAEKNRKRSVGW